MNAITYPCYDILTYYVLLKMIALIVSFISYFSFHIIAQDIPDRARIYKCYLNSDDILWRSSWWKWNLVHVSSYRIKATVNLKYQRKHITSMFVVLGLVYLELVWVL